MTEGSPNERTQIEEEFLERVEKSVSKVFEELVNSVDAQFRLLEDRIDAQDMLLANLFKGYTEMNAAVEGLFAEVMKPSSEQEREKFRQDLNKRYITMLKQMNEVGREVERTTPQDPTASILRMAGEDPGDSTFGERSESSRDGFEDGTSGVESGDGNEAARDSASDLP